MEKPEPLPEDSTPLETPEKLPVVSDQKLSQPDIEQKAPDQIAELPKQEKSEMQIISEIGSAVPFPELVDAFLEEKETMPDVLAEVDTEERQVETVEGATPEHMEFDIDIDISVDKKESPKERLEISDVQITEEGFQDRYEAEIKPEDRASPESMEEKIQLDSMSTEKDIDIPTVTEETEDIEIHKRDRALSVERTSEKSKDIPVKAKEMTEVDIKPKERIEIELTPKVKDEEITQQIEEVTIDLLPEDKEIGIPAERSVFELNIISADKDIKKVEKDTIPFDHGVDVRDLETESPKDTSTGTGLDFVPTDKDISKTDETTFKVESDLKPAETNLEIDIVAVDKDAATTEKGKVEIQISKDRDVDITERPTAKLEIDIIPKEKDIEILEKTEEKEYVSFHEKIDIDEPPESKKLTISIHEKERVDILSDTEMSKISIEEYPQGPETITATETVKVSETETIPIPERSSPETVEIQITAETPQDTEEIFSETILIEDVEPGTYGTDAEVPIETDIVFKETIEIEEAEKPVKVLPEIETMFKETIEIESAQKPDLISLEFEVAPQMPEVITLYRETIEIEEEKPEVLPFEVSITETTFKEMIELTGRTRLIEETSVGTEKQLAIETSYIKQPKEKQPHDKESVGEEILKLKTALEEQEMEEEFEDISVTAESATEYDNEKQTGKIYEIKTAEQIVTTATQEPRDNEDVSKETGFEMIDIEEITSENVSETVVEDEILVVPREDWVEIQVKSDEEGLKSESEESEVSVESVEEDGYKIHYPEDDIFREEITLMPISDKKADTVTIITEDKDDIDHSYSETLEMKEKAQIIDIKTEITDTDASSKDIKVTSHLEEAPKIIPLQEDFDLESSYEIIEIDIHEETIEGPKIVPEEKPYEKVRIIPIKEQVKSDDQEYFIEYPQEPEREEVVSVETESETEELKEEILPRVPVEVSEKPDFLEDALRVPDRTKEGLDIETVSQRVGQEATSIAEYSLLVEAETSVTDTAKAEKAESDTDIALRYKEELVEKDKMIVEESIEVPEDTSPQKEVAEMNIYEEPSRTPVDETPKQDRDIFISGIDLPMASEKIVEQGITYTEPKEYDKPLGTVADELPEQDKDFMTGIDLSLEPEAVEEKRKPVRIDIDIGVPEQQKELSVTETEKQIETTIIDLEKMMPETDIIIPEKEDIWEKESFKAVIIDEEKFAADEQLVDITKDITTIKETPAGSLQVDVQVDVPKPDIKIVEQETTIETTIDEVRDEIPITEMEISEKEHLKTTIREEIRVEDILAETEADREDLELQTIVKLPEDSLEIKETVTITEAAVEETLDFKVPYETVSEIDLNYTEKMDKFVTPRDRDIAIDIKPELEEETTVIEKHEIEEKEILSLELEIPSLEEIKTEDRVVELEEFHLIRTSYEEVRDEDIESVSETTHLKYVKESIMYDEQSISETFDEPSQLSAEEVTMIIPQEVSYKAPEILERSKEAGTW